MDVQQLRAFIQAAETGSITRAAKALRTSQPSLSRWLRLLEEELGEVLFDRSERGVVLTEVGDRLLQRASELVLNFDALKADLSGDPKDLAGKVRFGVPKSLSESYVGPALVRFYQQYPGISISLTEGITRDLIEQIRMGSLDIAIVSDLDRSLNVRVESLLREPIVLAARADATLCMSRPVDGSTVARHQIVAANHPNIVRLTLEDALRLEGVKAQVAFETNSNMICKALVCSGTLYGVALYSAIAADLQAGRLTAAPIRGAAVSWNVIDTPLRELPRQAVVLRNFMIHEAAIWVKRQCWSTGPGNT